MVVCRSNNHRLIALHHLMWIRRCEVDSAAGTPLLFSNEPYAEATYAAERVSGNRPSSPPHGNKGAKTNIMEILLFCIFSWCLLLPWVLFFSSWFSLIDVAASHQVNIHFSWAVRISGCGIKLELPLLSHIGLLCLPIEHRIHYSHDILKMEFELYLIAKQNRICCHDGWRRSIFYSCISTSSPLMTSICIYSDHPLSFLSLGGRR